MQRKIAHFFAPLRLCVNPFFAYLIRRLLVVIRSFDGDSHGDGDEDGVGDGDPVMDGEGDGEAVGDGAGGDAAAEAVEDGG